MMAVQFHVHGPTTVTYGGQPIGSSDGRALITVSERNPARAITTDARGGEPADYIQLYRHALVTVSFVSWDKAQMDIARAPMSETSTNGSPAFETIGHAGNPGMLWVADGGSKTLVVAGTKITGANGGRTMTFNEAFPAPDVDQELSQIGVAAALQGLSFMCLGNDSDVIYTFADISS